MNAARALWWRDMLRFKREPSRWLGIVAQPLMFWIIIGSGLTSSFKAPGLEGVSYLEYFYPGTLVMCILFTAIFSSISIIEDRQAGFLQSVLVTPTRPISIIFGKVMGVTSLTLMQAVLFLLAAPFAHYAVGQIAWGLLFTAIILGSFCLASINFAMAWYLNSTQSFHAVMSIILIPLWILSGSMFPLNGTWLQWIGYINPMTYITNCVRLALLGRASIGFDSGKLIAQQFSILALFVVIGFLLALFAMKKSEENI